MIYIAYQTKTELIISPHCEHNYSLCSTNHDHCHICVAFLYSKYKIYIYLLINICISNVYKKDLNNWYHINIFNVVNFYIYFMTNICRLSQWSIDNKPHCFHQLDSNNYKLQLPLMRNFILITFINVCLHSPFIIIRIFTWFNWSYTKYFNV